MFLQLFKKIMFLNTKLKLAIYLGGILAICTLGDFVVFPKTYFSKKDNLFNVYFVKIGWLWTLSFTALFLTTTSYTLCCGDKIKVLQNHLPRILIATFFWYFWTKMFNIIELQQGHCVMKGFATKTSCLTAGHKWKALDISGHCFILIYSSLVLIEEARPILKWEMIERHVLSELENRNASLQSDEHPLKNLTQEQLESLKHSYEVLTPLVEALFIGMSALQLLWDVMLVCTMIYYHSLIEKMLGGMIAIHTWLFTYRFWYVSGLKPISPGSGSFIYQ